MVLKNGPQPIVIHDAANNTFTLDENALRRILLHDDVKDKPVAVVSVAGEMRKGKSFMLNLFLRYMRHRQACAVSSSLFEDWLADLDAPFEGFSWRSGMDGNTSGILMWDEVFTVTTSEGKQVAVVFMDTEGMFYQGATMKECTTIFALSTLISSIQVYNISQNLQENHLQFLQFFTEYGRLAAENTSEKPFQKLMFLVRDWSYLRDAAYGAEGGAIVLDKWLKVSEQQHEDVRQIREHIRSCFPQMDSFLMPHPGDKVATSDKFDVLVADIKPDFIAHLNDLATSLLAPDNLLVKTVNGTEITCGALVNYFKAFKDSLEKGGLQEPRSILQIFGQGACMTDDELEEHHKRFSNSALERFRAIPRFGGDDYIQRFLGKLTKGIDTQYNMYAESNESRQAAAQSEWNCKIYKGLAIASTVVGLGVTSVSAALASGTVRAAIGGAAEISSNGALSAAALAVVGAAKATTKNFT
ncbi:atlastin-1-like [Ornithodoros turicata]|uniref:atlastin-1-like n=1 Tax=Ornithodoros turicata TaxID=34597 RepID=UPI0031391ADC